MGSNPIISADWKDIMTDRNKYCRLCDVEFKSRIERRNHGKDQHNPSEFLRDTQRKGNFECQFCRREKLTTTVGNKLHEKFCEENPNRELRRHTPESKKKLSENMKERHRKGIADKWKNPTLKESYPEKFFTRVIKNEIDNQNVTRELPIRGYWIDFAWVDEKKAIEIDGDQHLREYQKQSDRRKDKALSEEGWDILRIRWKDLYNNPQKYIEIARQFIDGCGKI